MNCLTYLLDLWRKGERFKILYSGDHCIGYNSEDYFDFGNYTYKKSETFISLEKCHSKETVIKIFDLLQKDIETINEYYTYKKIRE